jgi:hypothetical protein
MACPDDTFGFVTAQKVWIPWKIFLNCPLEQVHGPALCSFVSPSHVAAPRGYLRGSAHFPDLVSLLELKSTKPGVMGLCVVGSRELRLQCIGFHIHLLSRSMYACCSQAETMVSVVR